MLRQKVLLRRSVFGSKSGHLHAPSIVPRTFLALLEELLCGAVVAGCCVTTGGDPKSSSLTSTLAVSCTVGRPAVRSRV